MCIQNLASFLKVHELKILHISFAFYARTFRYFSEASSEISE